MLLQREEGADAKYSSLCGKLFEPEPRSMNPNQHVVFLAQREPKAVARATWPARGALEHGSWRDLGI